MVWTVIYLLCLYPRHYPFPRVKVKSRNLRGPPTVEFCLEGALKRWLQTEVNIDWVWGWGLLKASHCSSLVSTPEPGSSAHVLGGEERLRREIKRAHSWTRKCSPMEEREADYKASRSLCWVTENLRDWSAETLSALSVSEKFKVREALCLGGSIIPALSETLLPVMLSPQGQMKCHILVDLEERWGGKPGFQKNPFPSLIPVLRLLSAFPPSAVMSDYTLSWVS